MRANPVQLQLNYWSHKRTLALPCRLVRENNALEQLQSYKQTEVIYLLNVWLAVPLPQPSELHDGLEP